MITPLKLVFFLLLLGMLLPFDAIGQSARQRTVDLSVTILGDLERIQLNWTLDSNAPGYTVFRKNLEDNDWGTPLATLSGDAFSFTDTEIIPGMAYEYAVFRKGFDPIVTTFCLPAGTDLELVIEDMYGIGLCCNFGFGYYQVEVCGAIVASGADFGMEESTLFSVCDNGNVCEDVTITIQPDMFPNSTSWKLIDPSNDDELASSGEVGDFIAERAEYGYVYAGIEVAPIEKRGTLLLLVEEMIANELTADIDRLRLDLIKDGWVVLTEQAGKEESVTAIKNKIQDLAAEHPDLSTVFILGHVPVPYSGNIYPDTHSENHQGAWSADAYYADLDGTWTDNTANITTAFFDRNHNIPGDGKFDQGAIPSEVELEIGRVDFFDMPAFQEGEVALMRRYLQKNHLFRQGAITVQRKGLVDDNFGNAFAAPAASAWRNFSTMFGTENIEEGDYFEDMGTESYLWSYGCGSGSHISAEGIGTTDDFASDSLLSVFTMLFGSQFGDWDNKNNFLRAPLASGLTLTNCWAGNPPWTFHHMSMGYHIGYSTLKTQNSNNLVYLNGPQLVHVALLGDPSLHMFPVKPPSFLTAIQGVGNDIQLTWNAPVNESIVGYHLYRASDLDAEFERINTDLITATSYIDQLTQSDQYFYMVRAVKLETTSSGSFYNMSAGDINSIDFLSSNTNISNDLNIDVLLTPNPVSNSFSLQFNSLPENFSLVLLDLNGKIIWDREQISEGQENYNFQLPTIPSGLYWLSIEGENVRILKRMVIIN